MTATYQQSTGKQKQDCIIGIVTKFIIIMVKYLEAQ